MSSEIPVPGALAIVMPPSRTLRSVASRHRQGHSPFRVRPRKAACALVDLAAELRDRRLRDAAHPHGLHELVPLARGHAREPRLLEQASSAIGPRTMASATSAFSTGLRGSRKPGKQDPVLSFATRRFSGPSRVSSVRSREPLRHVVRSLQRSWRPAPITPPTSASMMICSTPSATAREARPRPRSTPKQLGQGWSVIGRRGRPRGPGEAANPTLPDDPGDRRHRPRPGGARSTPGATGGATRNRTTTSDADIRGSNAGLLATRSAGTRPARRISWRWWMSCRSALSVRTRCSILRVRRRHSAAERIRGTRSNGIVRSSPAASPQTLNVMPVRRNASSASSDRARRRSLPSSAAQRATTS